MNEQLLQPTTLARHSYSPFFRFMFYTILISFLILTTKFLRTDLPYLKQIYNQKNQADLAFKAKNYIEAKKQYESLFHQFPNYIEVRYRLIESCFALSEQSYDYFEEAFDYFPGQTFKNADLARMRTFLPKSYHKLFDYLISTAKAVK